MNELTPQQKFAQKLLNLATWYAAHPDAPIPGGDIHFSIGDFKATPEEIKAIGAGKKQYDDTFFTYVVEGDGFMLRFLEYRRNVCERKVIGTKIVPAQTVPARAAEFIPEHEEDIVEWECPGSLLSPEVAA